MVPDLCMITQSGFAEIRFRPVEVLYQVPPVGEITVICLFSAEGFIFQKSDGYLPDQAGSHILQAGQFSVRSYGYLIRSGGK